MLRSSLVMFAVATASACVAQPVIETVALSGNTGAFGPQLGPSIVFEGRFLIGSINSNGALAVAAGLGPAAGGPSNGSGVWHYGASGLRLIARDGAPAPGISPAATLAGFGIAFNRPSINDAGQVAFQSQLAGIAIDASNRDVLCVDSNGLLSIVFRTADQAPNMPLGANFNVAAQRRFGFSASAGTVSLIASTSGGGVPTTSNSGLWTMFPSQPTQLVREGAILPGAGTRPLGTLETEALSISDTGDIGLRVSFAENNQGSGLVYIPRSGVPSVVLLSQATSGPGGARYSGLGRPFAVTPVGLYSQVDYTGGSVQTSNNTALIRVDSTGPTILTREGDTATGFPQGSTLGDLSEALAPIGVANNIGSMVFTNRVNGPGLSISNNSGLWIQNASGEITLIARSGVVLPELPAGSIFDSVTSFPGFLNLVVNDQDQVLFAANLRTGSSLVSSIWLWDRTQGLLPIVKAGDSIACGDGITRLATSVGVVSGIGGDGLDIGGGSRSLADGGWISFRAGFASQQGGVFRTRVVPSTSPTCDSIDFNNDSLFPADEDLVDLLSVLAGGPCSPNNTCNDIDFNNDGLFPDDNDLIAFLRVLAGGNC